MIASEAGDWLVDASAWLALVLYPVGLAGGGARPSERASRRARLLFSLGGVVFLVHVVSAFAVHYDLSHARALEETARQTEDLTGLETGIGLFLNYLFAMLWLLEILWWYAAPASYRSRRRAISASVHGFFIFMILNGAVVFVPWPRRALGCGILVLCALALWVRMSAASPAGGSGGQS